jgi:hypothetical protein
MLGKSYNREAVEARYPPKVVRIYTGHFILDFRPFCHNLRLLYVK